MATTTYCVRADIESIYSAHGVDMAVDDDQDGIVLAAEETFVDRAIVRAAGKINSRVQKRYTLSELSNNDWMRDVNATIAAQILARRRGNGSPPSLDAEVDSYMEDLDDIRGDRLDIPEQNASLDYTPVVSNYVMQRGQVTMKPRVDTGTSTGDTPHSTRKRFPASHLRHS
jgi:hypothetical protein